MLDSLMLPKDFLEDPYLANWKHKKIMEQIKMFEEKLDDNHEIAIQLTSFGVSKLMAVHEISYQNPDMLYFFGTVDGQPAQLIQHTSQLNFLIIAVEKPDLSAPARRISIGFRDSNED